MKLLTITGFLFFSCLSGHAQNTLISKVYRWEEMSETRSLPGKKKNFIEGASQVFDYLEIHATTLFSGNKRAPLIHKHPDHEELIIVKEGILDATLKGRKLLVPAGGIILVCPGDEHIISNGSDIPAVYYIFRWKTNKSGSAFRPDRTSVIRQWTDLKFTSNDKGGRCDVMHRPTAQLKELEMHVDILREGVSTLSSPLKKKDEFILVKSGELKIKIDSHTHLAGTGSLIYVTGNQNQGITNTGKGTCEFFTLRMR